MTRQPNRLRLFAACIGVVAFLFPGAGKLAAAPEFERFEFVKPRMGTLFQVALFADDAGRAEAAANAAFARIQELNDCLSDYDRSSEVVRLHAISAGASVTVSSPLWEILSTSVQLSEWSDGAFDATAGRLSQLWREARRTGKMPAEPRWQEARAASGYQQLQLNSEKRSITFAVDGVQLDLGGIAKGYAADEALAVLRAHGFPRAMVAASGDLALGDPPPGKRGWRVELRPDGDRSDRRMIIEVANAGVSTSGDAEQFVEIEKVRYSHILDPRSGTGLTVSQPVTVVAPRAMWSDAWATACTVLGTNLSPAALKRSAQSVVVIFHGTDNVEILGRKPKDTVLFYEND